MGFLQKFLLIHNSHGVLPAILFLVDAGFLEVPRILAVIFLEFFFANTSRVLSGIPTGNCSGILDVSFGTSLRVAPGIL